MTVGETQALRWGILGAARIARERVVPAVRASALHRFVALGSRDGTLAQAVAAELGVDRAYGSYAEVLADEEVQAVYIPLPNHLHVEWTLRAVAAGKHVLCEKPLALAAADVRRVAEAAGAAGVRVMEGFMVLFHPRWLAVRDLIRSGAVGEVGSIHVGFANPNFDPANIRNRLDTGGGALYDKGCYCIALSRFLLGAEPEGVDAVMDIDTVFGVDRLTSALLRFSQSTATFTCSSQHAPHQQLTVLGTKGRIEVPVAITPSDAEPTIIRHDPGQDLAGTGAREIAFEPCNHYRLMFDAFALGSTSTLVPLTFSEANAAVIDRILTRGQLGM